MLTRRLCRLVNGHWIYIYRIVIILVLFVGVSTPESFGQESLNSSLPVGILEQQGQKSPNLILLQFEQNQPVLYEPSVYGIQVILYDSAVIWGNSSHSESP